ncbi:ribonuclease H-like domain-containing protein [Tanacetum coccineum]
MRSEDEATPSGEQSSPLVPKTAKQLAARRNQERIKSILLLAIPDEYLLKFHNVPDAKSLWAAIKSRFGGNEESKKMQKNVLKHQFENFVTASNETLDKAYDRFQKLISQLEIHGAYVSKEDINQKFLRSLPPSWSQIALIMRNKPDIDEVDIDDLYNNLRVYEDELKRSSGSNSASQNLAFLSLIKLRSTNEVSTASGDFGVSTAGGINQVPTTPSAHDIAYSFLAQPTTSPQLENEDFQQMDGDDLEELDLRWQVAMLTVRVKKFIQRTGRNMDFKEKRHELVAQDGLGGYDWSNDFEVEPVNYALMAISLSNSSSSSDNEVLRKEMIETQDRRKKSGKGCIKNLTKILNSQMSTHDKNGLGFGTQMDDLSNKSETDSENSLTVFEVRSKWNPLTPRPNISFAGIDEYVFKNKIIESKTTETNKTVGTTNEASIVKPKCVNETVVSKSKINRDEVIIEDWTSDDEDDVCADKTVSSVKPNVTQAVRSQTSNGRQSYHGSNATSSHRGIRRCNCEARTWLDKEPPRSILTWDDLVSKFINQFFPPSKTTYLRNEIINFLQKPNETFNEAWERFKGLLRQCPHHGFSELHQLDTFYNSLNTNDQDALDSAAGGNFLNKMPDRYGYMKNHMKTVKNGQTRTQERKSEQKPEARARKIIHIISLLDYTSTIPYSCSEFLEIGAYFVVIAGSVHKGESFSKKYASQPVETINLTAPTLTFPDIKACDPFSIVDKPTTCLIYLNNKNEKRFMDLEELSKFCDDTLEKVLKEVKMKIFEIEFLKKAPLLGSLDLKIMKACERETVKRLKQRKQM